MPNDENEKHGKKPQLEHNSHEGEIKSTVPELKGDFGLDDSDGDAEKPDVPPDLTAGADRVGAAFSKSGSKVVLPPGHKSDAVNEEDSTAAKQIPDEHGSTDYDKQSREPEKSDSEVPATPFDDEKTGKAIADIVAKESDALLAAQDAVANKGGVKHKKRGGFAAFWRNKWTQLSVLVILLSVVAAVLIVPKTRYPVLNSLGVRSSASITIIDESTRLPLKGVKVALAGQKTETDSAGNANFSELKLGPAKLGISQIGFEDVSRDVVVGWGSNPLGEFALKATGIKYVIEVRDYLSEQPLEGVEATDGQVSALSDKAGKITLSLAEAPKPGQTVNLSKTGYRTESFKLAENPEVETKVTLVPARKAVFVTRQSGKFDLFKSDLDGKNRQILLPGTGHENSNISLAVSPDGKRAAFVSTRENKRDADGFLLSTLMIVNVDGGEAVSVGESAQIQLIDWIGTRVIFQMAAPAGSDSGRYTLVSYDYAKNSRVQIVSANKLSAARSAQGYVYYSIGDDPASSSPEPGFYRVRPDGSGKHRVLDKELTSVLRSDYDTFSLQASDGEWYNYKISSNSKASAGAPASLANRLYIDSPDGKRSLRVSQGTLLVYDSASGEEKDVYTMSGLTYPVWWVSDSIVIFRVSTGSETADYVIDLSGGEPHKVTDVPVYYGIAQAS